jgi:EmrB/QacA subfamily drug resistance transporter
LFKEGSERNRALGIWGAVAGGGGAVGVLLGGMLTTWLSWRWVLFVNVPVGVVAIWLAPGLLPESRSEHRRRIDVLGAVLVTAGLVVLVYGLVKTDRYGFGSTRTIATLALAAALLAAFVVAELVQRDPLIRLGIYRNRNVATANIIGFLNGVCLISMFFFISLYLQQVLGYSALTTGVCYVPLCIVIIVTAGSVGQVVTRIGVKPVVVTGLSSLCVGLYLFGHVDAGGSFGSDVLLPSVLAAFGIGCVFVTVTIIAVSGVAMEETGLASGLLTTAQQVGSALGVAILSTVANARTRTVLEASAALHVRPDLDAALTSGFRQAFTVGAGFALAGVLVAAVMIRDVRVPSAGTRAPAAA